MRVVSDSHRGLDCISLQSEQSWTKLSHILTPHNLRLKGFTLLKTKIKEEERKNSTIG